MSYSPPKYPASIPNTTTDLPDQTDDIDWIEAWIYNYVKKELIAVMTELGTDPAGAEATVAARLTAIEASGVDESVIMNIYLNSFRIAILGSYAVMNMVKGISDEYEDETGIDTTASTYEDYNSANDLYSPDSSFGADVTSGETYSESKFDTGDPGKGGDASFLFDDDTDTYWRLLSAGAGDWCKIEFAVAKTIAQYTIRCETANNTYAWIAWTFQGSNNDSDWDDLDIVTGQSWSAAETKTYAVDTPASYKYYRFIAISGAVHAFSSEIQMMEAVTENMTLVSEKFVADETPDETRIIIFEEDVDAITLNTDIKAYVSRDDGANYTQITLTDEGNYSGSKRILSGTADISGQPEDTDMVYKIESLNEKSFKLHGTALSWA